MRLIPQWVENLLLEVKLHPTWSETSRRLDCRTSPAHSLSEDWLLSFSCSAPSKRPAGWLQVSGQLRPSSQWLY